MPGTSVSINPKVLYPGGRGGAKPRKGSFEIRVTSEGDASTIVFGLYDMARPFKKLKALDIDDVAEQTVEALAKI